MVWLLHARFVSSVQLAKALAKAGVGRAVWLAGLALCRGWANAASCAAETESRCVQHTVRFRLHPCDSWIVFMCGVQVNY
jgi:hypothetical protein